VIVRSRRVKQATQRIATSSSTSARGGEAVFADLDQRRE
jgi:hypothetical protein